jgi:hypothetical protein
VHRRHTLCRFFQDVQDSRHPFALPLLEYGGGTQGQQTHHGRTFSRLPLPSGNSLDLDHPFEEESKTKGLTYA